MVSIRERRAGAARLSMTRISAAGRDLLAGVLLCGALLGLSGCQLIGSDDLVAVARDIASTIIGALPSSPSPAPITERVTTSQGLLVGTPVDTSMPRIYTFLGVPYALPPVGALRWQAPQAPLSWIGERAARSNSPACIQGTSPTGSFFDSEDCLYLNIYAPSTPGPHPVMVWLHGGALLIGAGNEPQYDGSVLARERDVVVVTVNYRLGFTGFLALSQLSGASGAGGRSGNQGFYDQLAALRWVKQEIASFGGDPANVTLFGESAGAISSCLLLASPLSNGLFKRVILQSGNCEKMLAVVSQSQAETDGAAFLSRIGCNAAADPLQCARSKTTQEILAALGVQANELFKKPPEQWSYNPKIVIDGQLLPQSPMTLLAAGANAGVEVMLGTNKDEGSLFAELRDHAADAAGYLAELQAAYSPADAATLFSLYPHASFSSTGAAMAEISGDAAMHCPARALADVLSDAGHPVYFYHFVQPVMGLTYWIMTLQRGANTSDLGVFHSAEIPYAFGVSGVLGDLDTPERQLTASYMTRYWSGFARSGNPNAAGLPSWPRYTRASPGYLELGPNFTSKSALHQTNCAVYWNGVH